MLLLSRDTTDINGLYEFTNLFADSDVDYWVQVDESGF